MNKYLKQLIGVLILTMVVYGAYQFVYAQHPEDDGNIVSEVIKKTSIESELKNENFQNSSGNDAKKGLSNENVIEKNGVNTPKERSQITHSQNKTKDIKLFLNNKEIKLKESEINLEFSHEKTPISTYDKSIYTYKYFDINTTQNGNFYAGVGAIFNSKDEKISTNVCNLLDYDCGQEAGGSIFLLEDGEGFISVCASQYIRVIRMKNNEFINKPGAFWEIKSDGKTNEYYFGGRVGLTQDGKYMFVSVNESPIKIRKYNLDTKELVWEKSIDDKETIFRISPSPFSNFICINGNKIYDNDFQKIHTFRFDDQQDIYAYPKFFMKNGKESLLVKGVRSLWILNLENTNELEKISTENSDIIDWFQIIENKLLFQIRTEKNTFNLIELNLDDILISFEGKIMKSTKEYKKGGGSTIIKIDNASHKTYNFQTKLN